MCHYFLGRMYFCNHVCAKFQHEIILLKDYQHSLLTLPHLLLGCWWTVEIDYNLKEIEKDRTIFRTSLEFKILQLS